MLTCDALFVLDQVVNRLEGNNFHDRLDFMTCLSFASFITSFNRLFPPEI